MRARRGPVKTYTTANGRVGNDGNVVLGAGLGDAVVENVRAEHAELDLGAGDLDVAGGLVDGGGAALADADAAKLARVDVLALQDGQGLAKVVVVVTAGNDKDVNLGRAAQLLENVVGGPADALGRAVRVEGRGVDAALDGDGHALGILGVLGKVLLQQHQAVVAGRAVELGAVPQRRAGLDGRPQRLDGLLHRLRVGAPSKACRS